MKTKKINLYDFEKKYDALFKFIFYSDEFDKHIYFFDRLLSVEK